MSVSFEINPTQLAALKAAVNRNPAKTRTEVNNFLGKGLDAYSRVIIRSPWRIGGSGGGAPVDTGNLRDTHRKEIQPWEARIFPTAPYAKYVHGISGYSRKRSYQLRPWLDYAEMTADSTIRQLEETMLKNIVGDLAK
jgi:hypothetical protein